MIWVGTNCFTGATYINAGKRFHSQTLVADGIAMASAVANQVWGILDNGLAFDAPECWTIDGGVPNILYPGYERPIAIWDTFNALDPFFPGGAAPRLTRFSGIVAGEVSIRRRRPRSGSEGRE